MWRRAGLSAVAVGVVVLVVAAALALVPWSPEEEGDHADGDLRELADSHGLDLGVAAAVDPLVEDRTYQQVVSGNYTSMTAENTMKWSLVQPERGEFDFEGPDALVDFADEHGMSMRGHTLMWHNQLPEWLEEGDWEEEELREVVQEHAEALLGRYQGRMESWDVINEPFEDDGPELRENLWLEVFGEDYIADALWTANAVDPEAKLYINEFNVEGGGDKSDALYELASDLVERDVPLHGIGFQSHFVHGQVPEDLVEQMERFTDLGLEVTISELDVRIPDPAGEEEIQAQGEEYRRVVEACLEVARCPGVTVWGVADHHSWVPEWFPGTTDALPFDEDYVPKPARSGMVDALSRHREARRRGAAR
ncbi:endo-1,4-beta-xylanase [Nocardiopsis sp. HNM0947]|uniref:Beta-xylanase n=1 Tax=Nocardiopsis coralli TaxID=2772213 RepID=A0ABR9P6F0_9ACTN|nr:endo-1,4-beta-xylanase [Nocardiopsis coralli]